jgi:hypothetical protein
MPDITIAKLDEIERGLEGVTEGAWHFESHEAASWQGPGCDALMVNEDGDKVLDCIWASATEEGDRTYRHIARMDPATVRELVRLARIGLATEAMYRDALLGGISITRIAPADFYAEEPTP